MLQQVNAAATLVRSTVLNKHCQQVVLDATKANLPALINSCKGYSDDPIQKRDLVAMRWLCSKAGPAAVNVHEAGCAILHLVACHRNHMASKARLITDTGNLQQRWQCNFTSRPIPASPALPLFTCPAARYSTNTDNCSTMTRSQHCPKRCLVTLSMRSKAPTSVCTHAF